MAGRQGEVRELVKEIRANGFSVVSGGKHTRVLDPKGKLGPKGSVVRDKDGPVIISQTPGDVNWRDMAEGRLRRAGVLPAKAKVHKAKGANGQEELSKAEREKAQKVARQQATRGQLDERHQRTVAIRARLEPLVAKAGGWNHARGPSSTGVQLNELGMIAMLWAQRDPNQVVTFASEKAAAQSAQILREGGTLTDDRAVFWSALVTDWEDADNPQAWYFERLREAKGLAPNWRVKMDIAQSSLHPPVAEEEPQLPRSAGEQSVEAPPNSPSEAAPRPSTTREQRLQIGLGMRAVFLMARGMKADDPGWDEILRFGMMIATMREDK